MIFPVINLIELDDGTIYRKPIYLMVKTMVFCRFSLKPIHKPHETSHSSAFCRRRRQRRRHPKHLSPTKLQSPSSNSKTMEASKQQMGNHRHIPYYMGICMSMYIYCFCIYIWFLFMMIYWLIVVCWCWIKGNLWTWEIYQLDLS